MAGRPRLRIGQHGRIRRVDLGGGVWVAHTRYRDQDGVVRKLQHRGPEGVIDQYGKQAEEALIEAIQGRRTPAGGDITLETPLMALVGRHIDRLEEDGRAIRTIDTYRYDAEKLKKFLAGVRVGEATPGRLDAALRSMKKQHGATMARRARTILRGGLQLAVLADVLGSNPCRDVSSIPLSKRPEGAPDLTATELRDLHTKITGSEYAHKADLVDPALILIATGMRRCELLGLRWKDFNPTAGTLSVLGEVVRKKGHGLQWVPHAKTDAGIRTVKLPPFAVEALKARRSKPFIGDRATIFASTSGTLRDLDNFNKQWRKLRDAVLKDLPLVTSHSFRKTVATLLDDAGKPTRVASDQLGHAKVSMTQDRYMSRGRTHDAVADVIGGVINAE